MAERKKTSVDDVREEKVEKQETQKELRMAYVGPTLVRYGLVTNQVYMDGVPDRIKILPEEERGVLERLFVSTTELGVALRDVKSKGTALYALSEVAKQFRKENK